MEPLVQCRLIKIGCYSVTESCNADHFRNEVMQLRFLVIKSFSLIATTLKVICRYLLLRFAYLYDYLIRLARSVKSKHKTKVEKKAKSHN